MEQPAAGEGNPGVQGPIATDALVIGAGPVGLFQVFQLGLLHIQAHVVDALAFPGGQCAQLYGDKPIYDIPALPVCTGQELSERLLQQAAVFQPHYHWSQQVLSLTALPDGRLHARTNRGVEFHARTVLITAGAGAFVPRTLKIDGIASFEGFQVFYHQQAPAPQAGPVLVLGGDADAVQRALDLAQAGVAVTLSHRRDQFEASPAQLQALRSLVDAGQLQLCIGLPAAVRVHNGQLTGLGLTTASGDTRWVDARAVEAYLGISPTLAALKDWGIDLDRKAVRIDTATSATSLPGVFAAGDVTSYPGKKKLIVCGFHEACMAAYGVQAYLCPGQSFPLQYTSSSTQLQALLGVAHG